jgi:hypothetical protein
MTPEQRRWFWKGYIVGRSRSAQRLRIQAMQFWDEAEILRTDMRTPGMSSNWRKSRTG